MYALAKERLLPRIQYDGIMSIDPAFDTHHRPLSSDGRNTAYNRRLDKQQERRSIILRYLVAWMPWLGLLESFDEELLEQGISREGTGLESIMVVPRKITPGPPISKSSA
jgi:hypothetical protein